MNLVVIDLWPIVAECCVCGAASSGQGIPVFEGDILPNDHDGEWGGAPACKTCFDKQSRLTSVVSKEEFSRI